MKNKRTVVFDLSKVEINKEAVGAEIEKELWKEEISNIAKKFGVELDKETDE